jgi:hypothetical protein
LKAAVLDGADLRKAKLGDIDIEGASFRHTLLEDTLLGESESIPTAEPIPKELSELLPLVKQEPEMIRRLDPRKFEELVAELLSIQGFEVELTDRMGDGGIDLIAKQETSVGPNIFLIECKSYAKNRAVPVQAIRALHGITEIRKAAKGILVTTSHFSKQAEQYAEATSGRIQLVDFDKIREWLEHVTPANDADSSSAQNFMRYTYSAKKVKYTKVKPVEVKGVSEWYEEGYEKAALMRALWSGKTTAFMKYLSTRDLDINAKDAEGKTPLMIAAASGNVEIVKFLLDRDADINITEKEGNTALMMASYSGNVETVKLLLGRGADINITEKEGKTALAFARESGQTDAAKMLDKAVSVTISDEENNPRQTVASKKFLDAVEVLSKTESVLIKGAENNPRRLARMRRLANKNFLDAVEVLSKTEFEAINNKEDYSPYYRALRESQDKFRAKERNPIALALENQKEVSFRRWAAHALGNLGYDSSVVIQALVELSCGDEDEEVRFTASKTLSEIGADVKSAVPALVEVLKLENETFRSRAVELLKIIGTPAVPALTEVLKSSDPVLRGQAKRMLQSIAPDTMEDMETSDSK